MGGFLAAETAEHGGRPPGKIEASLNEELNEVEWGEYRIIDVFYVRNTGNILSADIVENSGRTPYLCASVENNAISTYISFDEQYKEKGNCIFIGGKTFVVTYQERDFYSNDSHNLVLSLKNEEEKTKANQLFMAACISKSLSCKYTWGNSVSNAKIQTDTVKLPCRNGKINFSFMEKWIAGLEAQRIAELEAYLSVTGLKDYELTAEEQNALALCDQWDWKLFNLEALFGRSTRGKRLKGSDRIAGNLPFVTAGEADEGISAFIGNDVEVFSANTTTIDMFGSAKYRSYDYGGDDHIAVVHTEKLPKFAAIFTTAAIHKAAHTGKFDYGHNFYAKDADELSVWLPAKGRMPDYLAMEMFLSAVQKLVVKDVVAYADQRIATTKAVTEK